jgi:multidrug resistance efflux pump
MLPILLLALAIGLGYWLITQQSTANDGTVRASGAIEAQIYDISAELGGRVIEVSAQEGQSAQAGQVLVALDATLLKAQSAQAQAVATAAAAQAQAAAANLAQLQASPTSAQLKVAQTLVDKAQLAVDALQSNYDDLPTAAQDSATGKQLAQQIDQAQASLANAQAQYDLLAAGATDEQLQAAQAQVDAATAQAAAAQAALGVLEVQIAKLQVTTPIDGTVLQVVTKPGAIAVPGASLVQIADLNQLELTVYVPEDVYGQIRLGQTAQVSVDSFAGQTFTASVVQIADQAEFTPRNVQTGEGRKSTVFAVKLKLENPDGKLKPGMPADVTFLP